MNARLGQLTTDYPLLTTESEFAGLGDQPPCCEKIFDRSFLDSLLYTQLVIKKVVGEFAGLAVHAVDANSVAVPIGTNLPYFNIFRGHFANAGFCSHRILIEVGQSDSV